jgi:hypothetical protein
MMRLFGGGTLHAQLAHGQGTFVARAHLVCSECRHAQLYAVQPRAVCTCPAGEHEGRLVFSGQPACEHIQPRRGDDRTLAWCSLRAATSQLRFGQVRPHLY